MAKIVWDDGRLITLEPGDIANCHNLNKGQLYGLIFYNSAVNDVGANLSVIWNHSEPPVSIAVPGTDLKKGLTSVLLVNGTDTDMISVVMLKNKLSARVQCYIVSTNMPLNNTGIINQCLPSDGKNYPFEDFTRYYYVPKSNFYKVHLQSNINKFTAIQFSKQAAVINIVKSFANFDINVQAVGVARNQYIINATASKNKYWDIDGNNKELVWVNIDRIKSSQNASICMQSLGSLSEEFNNQELQVVK